MPKLNFYIFFITAAFPIILGAIYYNPKVLGKAWLSAAGLTQEKVMSGNMTKILLLSYLFGLFVSYIIFYSQFTKVQYTSCFCTKRI